MNSANEPKPTVKKTMRFRAECVCGRFVTMTIKERYKTGKACEHDYAERGSGWSVCSKCGRVRR